MLQRTWPGPERGPHGRLLSDAGGASGAGGRQDGVRVGRVRGRLRLGRGRRGPGVVHRAGGPAGGPARGLRGALRLPVAA
ncbi:unnamed protein product, partial [Heterosigma akashiwo]